MKWNGLRSGRQCGLAGRNKQDSNRTLNFDQVLNVLDSAIQEMKPETCSQLPIIRSQANESQVLFS
jgi:hypothetical protein